MVSIGLLKWIALVAMFIDHIALMSPTPESHLVMRGIGRATFLIFGFLIAYQYAIKPQQSNQLFNKQSKWLFGFAILSILPYLLYSYIISDKIHSIYDFHNNVLNYTINHSYPLNIFFTLFGGGLIIHSIQVFKRNNTQINKQAIISLILSILITIALTKADYGLYGLIYILISYISINLIQRDKQILGWIIGSTSGIILNANLWLQYNDYLNKSSPLWLGFFVFSIPIILFYLASKNWIVYDKEKPSNLKKVFFYGFYPTHLILIALFVDWVIL